MDFDEYQREARKTDQYPKTACREISTELAEEEVIPLLGMVGEVGVLIAEYKKKLRDGEIYRNFETEVAEELGDVLWYVSNVADKFNLRLGEIASANLVKTRNRWLSSKDTETRFYDDERPSNQRLPRQFKYQFKQSEESDGRVVRVQMVDLLYGAKTGNALRDNSYKNDGYRFHDVIHLAFATYLGWSPVLRKLLRDRKQIMNRTPGETDDAEDGGRAQVIEEAIVADAYFYAEDHMYLEGATTVGQDLLKLEVNSEVRHSTLTVGG